MKNIISPMQIVKSDAGRMALLTRLAADLIRIHKEVVDRITYFEGTLSRKNGPKGDKGADADHDRIIRELEPVVRRFIKEIYVQPRDGETPSDERLISIIRPLIPQVTDGMDGVDGEDAVITDEHIEVIAKKAAKLVKAPKVPEIDPMAIIDAILKLPPGKRLSTKHIDGFEQTVSALHNQTRRGYLHGGGDTIRAGAGVSITSNSDGTKTITSTGVIFATASGTIDGSNRAFTVTAAPLYVVADGSQYFENQGYTRVGLTITLNFPPSGFVKYAY